MKLRKSQEDLPRPMSPGAEIASNWDVASIADLDQMSRVVEREISCRSWNQATSRVTARDMGIGVTGAP